MGESVRGLRPVTRSAGGGTVRTVLCVAMQGHLDELFRREEALEQQVAALRRLAEGGRKAGPRQGRVTNG